MAPPRVEFHDDHLAIRFEGIDRVEALRRAVVVPYGTIANADVGAPAWPGLTAVRVGTHVPQLVARGTFHDKDRWRFVDIHRGTQRALTLRLREHAEFDEVTVDVGDAGKLLHEIARHAPVAPTTPPVME